VTESAVDRWSAILAGFEASIEDCARLAAAASLAGAPPRMPVPGPVPADAGPLPRELAGRLDELLAHSRQIQVELARARDETAAELAALAHVTHVYGSGAGGERLDQLG
jgi:hypothetical protein